MRLVSVLLALFAVTFTIDSVAAAKPNIIFILADDMGYGDLGCYGHPVAKTPVLDALAKQGARFTQHYANGPECSPTRTAFLTGRYQQLAGGLECAIGTGNVGRYDDAIRLANQRELGLPAEQSVIPRDLKAVGYQCAVFGKWHLGYEPKFNPMHHGWHRFFGYLGGNVHYFNHRETSDLHVLFEGKLPVYRDGYMTHLITDASLQFIEQNKDRPFFLYVSHECPHFPFQGPKDSKKVVTSENWMEADQKTYVAMLEDLNAEVGRLLKKLDELKLAENTLVIFVSDNGGYGRAANMGPLSGAKSTTLEGGIRVPLIIRWPGHIKPGTTSNQACITFDLTASIMRIAGTETAQQRLDGIDIIDHVVKGQKDKKRTLFWRGKRGTRTWWAARDGDLKYVRKTEDDKTQEWLFDLTDDISEKHNLLNAQPKNAERLRSLLSKWEVDVKALR